MNETYPYLFVEIPKNLLRSVMQPNNEPGHPVSRPKHTFSDSTAMNHWWCMPSAIPPKEDWKIEENCWQWVFYHLDLLAQFEDHQKQMFQIPAKNHFQSDRSTGEALVTGWWYIHQTSIFILLPQIISQSHLFGSVGGRSVQLVTWNNP